MYHGESVVGFHCRWCFFYAAIQKHCVAEIAAAAAVSTTPATNAASLRFVTSEVAWSDNNLPVSL